MNRRTISLSFCAVLLLFSRYCDDAKAQGIYESVDKAAVMECVLDFVDNREKVSNYGCLIEMDHTSVKDSGIGNVFLGSIVFENREAELRRTDAAVHSLSSVNVETLEPKGDPVQMPAIVTFHDKDKTRYFVNLVERDSVERRFHFAPDPWMVPISSLNSLVSRSGSAGERDFWQDLLDEGNLLWAESNLQNLRSEWKFGAGCYVQVYFSKKLENLPVLVRYIVPKDPEKRFEKIGKTMVSENQIEWKKLRGGYVPVEVKSTEEQYWSSKPGIKFSDSTSVRFTWDTDLLDKAGKVNPDVFVPGKLTSEDLKRSFEKKSKRSR